MKSVKGAVDLKANKKCCTVCVLFKYPDGGGPRQTSPLVCCTVKIDFAFFLSSFLCRGPELRNQPW